MRKYKREITDFEKIADLIKNTDTIRLGINDEKYPYVVPVSFGYEVLDGKVIFYFHGAKEGKKVELISKNPNVCIEGDICHRFMATEKSVTCLYESFIAFGKCEKLRGKSALYGLEKIMEHCGYSDCEVNSSALPVVSVYKIVTESITAKERTKEN